MAVRESSKAVPPTDEPSEQTKPKYYGVKVGGAASAPRKVLVWRLQRLLTATWRLLRQPTIANCATAVVWVPRDDPIAKAGTAVSDRAINDVDNKRGKYMRMTPKEYMMYLDGLDVRHEPIAGLS